jgi:hypothetical protein
MLDVSDGRTLDKLMRRAGFTRTPAGTLTPEQFLHNQHFVAREHPVLRILRLLLSEHARVNPSRLQETPVVK